MKCELVKLDQTHVTADVSYLNKTGGIFFNATEMGKQFNKKANDFLRIESTKDYIQEILADSESGISRLENLIRTQKGGRFAGTWLHQELAYEFAGWCSAAFRRKLHKWADNRLTDEQARKVNRLELRTGFKPLTEAILHAHAEPKPYHFTNECNLINRVITGMDAKHFKTLHGVDNVRDALNAEQMHRMEQVQRQSASLIELGFSYEDRKRLLQKGQVARLEG